MLFLLYVCSLSLSLKCLHIVRIFWALCLARGKKHFKYAFVGKSLIIWLFLAYRVLEGLKQNVLVRKSVTLMPLNKLHIIMKEACLTEAKRGCSTKYSKPGNWSYHVSMKIWSVWGANKPLINKHHRKQGTPWTSLRGFFDIRHGLSTANIEWDFYPDNNVLEKEYRWIMK